MGPVQIAPSKDHFTREGKPFFYLADTAWSAFTNADEGEWETFLEYRRVQGYNAVQINILSQWDRSASPLDIHPFARKTDGSYDFDRINDAYFDRAERMVARAVEKGFVPALVVLWCNYVADTWCSRNRPYDVMPYRLVRPYVEYAVDRFAKYHPMYLVSGDTGFSPDAETYYQTAMETIKRKTPDALTTLHLSQKAEIPEGLLRSPHLDFYMYQSSHFASYDWPYVLAEKFCAVQPRRPVLNGEPCYEGMGPFKGRGPRRFSASDVRRAVWQSLLAGAKAGVTYGAHGIWSWHHDGYAFAPEPSWDRPFDWRTALTFPGSWDTAFAKSVFDEYGGHELEPVPQEKVLHGHAGIRMSASPNGERVLLYLPYSTAVKVEFDLSGYAWTLIELEERRRMVPSIGRTEGGWVVEPYASNGDALLVGVK